MEKAFLALSLSPLLLSHLVSVLLTAVAPPIRPAATASPSHHPGSPRRAFSPRSTAESASQSRPVSWRGPRSRQRWSSRDPSFRASSSSSSSGVVDVDCSSLFSKSMGAKGKQKKKTSERLSRDASSLPWPCLKARRGSRAARAWGFVCGEKQRRASGQGERVSNGGVSLPPLTFYVRCFSFFSLSLSLPSLPRPLFLSLSPSPLPVSLHRARLRFQNEQTAKMMSASIASFLKHVITKGAVKKQKQKNQLPLSLSLSPSLKAAAAVPAAALPRPRRLLLLLLLLLPRRART